MTLTERLRSGKGADRRCRKHEPVEAADPFRRLRGDVTCKNCGMKGVYSNGRRSFGRPRRVIWFRHLAAKEGK